MEEIKSLPDSGLRVVSTFSGGGGSSTGYRMAGMKVVLASEFIPAARETYAANWPDAVLDDRDIRQVSAEDLLAKLGMKVGELDVLDGSPPCSAFSTAGKRDKGWGSDAKKYSDATQSNVEDLFFEFARLVKGMQPRAFVAENVSGLVKGTAKGYFIEILQALKDCGYRVEARLLNAKWLGVPQSRQRIIFVGFRNDLGIDPVHPKPMPYFYSLRDVFEGQKIVMYGNRNATDFKRESRTFDRNGERSPNLPAPSVMAGRMSGMNQSQVRIVHDTSGTFSQGDVTDKPCPAITVGGLQSNACHYKVHEERRVVDVVHDTKGAFSTGSVLEKACPAITVSGGVSTHFKVTEEQDVSIERFAIGEEWKKLRPGETSEKYFSLSKPREDAACPTVTATGGNMGAAGVTHPSEPRKFTIAELKAICSFPPDYELTGTYQQQWERCGRAVPPLMMKAVAAAVRDALLKLDGKKYPPASRKK